MPELLAKLGQGAMRALTVIGTGKVQQQLGMQSPQLPHALTRIGRFFYTASLGWIAVSWYTGFVNMRTKDKSGPKFMLPAGPNPVINSPDRPNKGIGDIFLDFTGAGNSGGGGGGGIDLSPLVPGFIPKVKVGPITIAETGGKNRTLVPLAPDQLGVPGTAVAGYLWSAPSGDKQMPPYNAATYRSLVNVAASIGNQFGLHITSGYRPGSSGSLHSVGLAFDMVGRMTDMKRAAAWAAQNPGLFQEIFVHNEGSGMHLHIAFYPDAAGIFSSGSTRYQASRPAGRPAPNPTQSPFSTPTPTWS